MRVSSEHNKIAVPYLYEYITIGPGDKSPFAATTENMIRRPIQRKSVEKMNNLAKVKGVAISLPYVDDGDWNLPSQGLQVDWLRISERICQEYVDDVCHPITTGKALKQLRPDKLVVRTSYSQPSLDYGWSPSNVVLIHLPVTDPNFCPALPLLAMDDLPQEIVYVFWSKDPSGPSLICDELAVKELIEDLRNEWREQTAPLKVTFVNAGGINPKLFHRQARVNDTYEERETAFRAVFNDSFGLPGPSRGRWIPPHGGLVIPACTWMSMREYLTTHDWTGEFTAEEVEPWLRDEGTVVSE